MGNSTDNDEIAAAKAMEGIAEICAERRISHISRIATFTRPITNVWASLCLTTSPRYEDSDGPFVKAEGDIGRRYNSPRANDTDFAIGKYLACFDEWLSKQDGDVLEIRTPLCVYTEEADVIDPVKSFDEMTEADGVCIYMRARVTS